MCPSNDLPKKSSAPSQIEINKTQLVLHLHRYCLSGGIAMKSLYLFIFFTVVHFSVTGWAQEGDKARVDAARTECSQIKDKVEKAACENRWLGNRIEVESESVAEKKACAEARKDYKKKWDEFSAACAAAKMGGDCRESVKECFEAASEKDAEDSKDYMTQMMSQLGVSQKELQTNKCPTMNYKDWKSDHKDATEGVKSVKEKLLDAQKDFDKLGEEQNKAFQRLNKKYNDLIKNQKAKQMETKAAKREALLKRQDDLRKSQTSIADLEGRLREKSAEITAMHYDKATKLATASDAIAKFQCTSELEKKLKDMPKVKAGSFNSLSQSGGSSYNAKKLSLAACIESFQIGRKKEIQLFNMKIENAQKAMVAMEEDLKAAKDGLEAAKGAQDEAMQDLEQADKDALEDFNSRVAEIQKEMSDLSMDTNNKSRTLQKRIMDLTQQLTKETNDLSLLKAEKPKQGATETFEAAESKYTAAQTAFNDVLSSCKDASCNSSDQLFTSSIFCEEGGKRRNEKLRGASQ